MSQRLTSAVVPLHYDLQFTVDFEDFNFSGRESLTLEIQEQQTSLCLHCEDLSVHDLTLRAGQQEVACTFSTSDGELHVQPQAPLGPGNYCLNLCFDGRLGDDLSGLYRSRYADEEGQEKFLVTTQFEAPYARKAFPCFDEPSFKATFDVTMEVPAHMTGVSNMPVENETTANGRKTVRFATTPPMSTYLLYMGAGEFDFIEKEHNGRTIRVYGVAGKSRQGQFALDFTAGALGYYENYTGIAYPLPKLDLLAIPDFAAGAMENWGAVTFREVLLYVDPESSSLAVQKRVAEVIAHELWHQWSGNLVTMKWWDDLWLNEAFATYQAYRAVEQFFPQWQIWDDFIDSDTKGAFAMDMLSSTHPIAVPVHTPNEVEEIFDHISYGKGGSVLRMIEGYIGEKAFRTGVSAYLDAFKYGCATAGDLWDTLEANSGHPVKHILSAWVTKPGFPLLRASRKNDGLHIEQQRFSAGTQPETDPWPIPLTWISGEGPREQLFDTRECIVPDSGAWIKCNTGQSGFYRTLYNTDVCMALSTPIGSKALPAFDRWGILNDQWACVLAGHAGLSELLKVMSWYETEDHTLVLREIANQCDDIALYLRMNDRGKALFRYCRAPFAAVLDRLGWEKSKGEAPLAAQDRALAIGVLVRAGDEDANRHALELAGAYLDGGSIDPDIRGACLSAAAHSGSRELFDRVRKAYEEKAGIEEKVSLLSTLGGFADPDLLISYVDYALSDAVRRQDLRTVFRCVAHNPASAGCFFARVKDHWKTLGELWKSHFVYMGLLQALITTAPDTETLDKIREFLDRNSQGFEKTKATAFEKAALYIEFREREKRAGSIYALCHKCDERG